MYIETWKVHSECTVLLNEVGNTGNVYLGNINLCLLYEEKLYMM